MVQPARRKVDKSLQYRWGIVGAVLAVVGLIWFANTSGIMKYSKDTQIDPNVKIICPRCSGDPAKKATCSLCRGTGFLWVDKTKYLPGEVTNAP